MTFISKLLSKIQILASKKKIQPMTAVYKKWKEEGQIAEKRIEVAIVDKETKRTIKKYSLMF